MVMTKAPTCESCQGTGEMPTDYGCVDCPDCGGAGTLPSRSVLTEWRARDLERASSRGLAAESQDVRWLIAELRHARAALVEVVALAHDVEDDDAIAGKIRFVANRALGFHDLGPGVDPRSPR